MAEWRKAAQGGVSSARNAVTARGTDISSMEGAVELFPGESGDTVPREGAPRCATPAGEGTRAPVFDPDILSPVYPPRMVLRHVVDHWTPLMVTVLVDGPSRFGELCVGVGGVAPKVLTQMLQSMKRDGLVTHTQLPGVSPRVDYELTDLDRGFQALIGTLHTWIHVHSVQILTHHESYDVAGS